MTREMTSANKLNLLFPVATTAFRKTEDIDIKTIAILTTLRVGSPSA
jgi:hypothetical protein